MVKGFWGITRRHRIVAGRPVEDHFYSEPVGAVRVDKVPHDGVWLMQQVVHALAAVAVLLTVLAIGFFALAGCGPSDIEATAEQVRAADAAKRDTQAILLSHPLGFVATVRDCLPSGRDCTADRYYFPRSSR